MVIEITAIRLEDGGGHEHITDVRWRCETTSFGQTTRQAVIDRLSESDDNAAVVSAGTTRIPVAVVRHPDEQPYLRTHVDGVWTDHLLMLPKF